MPTDQSQTVGKMRIVDDMIYGQAPLAGGDHALGCRLYLPEARDTAPPLLAWFHGGGFVMGDHRRFVCHRIGKRMARAGFAVASVGYRLKARPDDLGDQVRESLDMLADHTGPHLRGRLCNHRALAAMEDGLQFVRWAQDHADQYGWSDALVLGGNSAGAITALNMLFTAPVLGLSRP